ncbi:TIGR03085 family metal-binding protein [Corynebacterium appendicis]|uniref:TIGR03085 family metal-binding protein n=1 Tax=Corynebacterium appendicis TaxID=163202 RepID=UPI0025511A3F|nr:TIGR03085 family metal-binding protein [Corynebacterium appendicis]MDK8625229.1 TIGR03085 family metal-binding protein [Corynebacterium appendicis]
MSFQQKEREKLAQLLVEKGPDAPTLCAGWTTADLAAHLYLRERKPYLAGGYFLSALSSSTKEAQATVKQRPYTEVVQEWAAGPPLFMKPLDKAMNTSEHFIHHEDVRRGGGEAAAREFSRVVENDLMKAAKLMGMLALKSSDIPVLLTPPNHPPLTLGGGRGVVEHGDRVVRVSGEPGELLLWVSGREAVEVTIDGDEQDIQKVKRQI